MPALEDSKQEIPGQPLAAWAEVLYLSNLLIAPGLAFLILLWLYFRRSANTPSLAVCHLRQTIVASIWAAALLLITSLAILQLGGLNSATTWIIVILYFLTCHATLVLLGVFGLTKALAGQKFSYPLIGRRCD